MSAEYHCEVCKAKAHEPCVNTIAPGQPLPGGRDEHLCRALPPDDTRRRRKAKRAS
jgi:hypothetical protein